MAQCQRKPSQQCPPPGNHGYPAAGHQAGHQGYHGHTAGHQGQHGHHAGQHGGYYNKCRDIFRRHKKPEAHLCEEALIAELKKGVMFGYTLFWLDENLRVCSEKFARGLTITCGLIPENWTYKMEKLSTGHCVEVAQLQRACVVEVQGCFDANMLASNTEYEVFFDIMMLPCAFGWDHPVKLSLTTPDGYEIRSEKCLKQFIGECYKDIPVGRFHTNNCKNKVGFKLLGDNVHLKGGLVVRGVKIRPAGKCGC